MNGFFFKKYSHCNGFSNFYSYTVFWFFAKNFAIKVKETFWRNNIIWYAFCSKFSKNPNFVRIWEILMFHCSGILRKLYENGILLAIV